MVLTPPTSPLRDGTIVRRLREEKDHDAIAAASHDPDAQRRLEDEPETHGARHDCTMFALVRSDRARR